MTVLDAKLAAKVVSILATYGTTATLSLIDRTFNKVSSTASTSTTTSSVKASPPAHLREGYRPGTTTPIVTLETYIASTGLARAPRTADTVTIYGIEYPIVMVEPIMSGDSAAAYRLELVK